MTFHIIMILFNKLYCVGYVYMVNHIINIHFKRSTRLIDVIRIVCFNFNH